MNQVVIVVKIPLASVVSDDDKPGRKDAEEFALGYAVLRRGAPRMGR